MTEPRLPGRPGVLTLVGVVTLVVSLGLAFFAEGQHFLGPYFEVDATARLFLVLIHLVFLGIAYTVWTRVPGTEVALEDRSFTTGSQVWLSVGFLLAADLSILSNHFIGGWVALECTTLAAAPLIVREGAPSSIQASWRYFLFSCVGLGLVLLGLLCLSRGLDGHGVGDLFIQVSGRASARNVSGQWGTAGLGLVILGYGAKLGLAPMYMWLPGTYEEAPPPVTSMLAAIQFNCALVGLLRVLQVFRAGNEQLVSTELIGMGLASVALATGSLIATKGIRRLIAYASILHAGVIAIGLGVGGGAGYGVLLYAVSNAFIKAMLFLTAGKIEAQYGTQDTSQIRGVIKRLPFSGLFLMAGTFALLGFPPFGSFVGELLILSGLVRSGYLMTFATLGFLITVTFLATGRTVFPMIWGESEEVTDPGAGSGRSSRPGAQTFVSFVPKLIFLAVLIVLGLHLPAPVNALFREVAMTLGDE